MKVIIFGATGMIGSGVLLECLRSPRIESILAIGRSRTSLARPKLRELVHTNLFDYADIRDELSGYDACYFCLGVSAAGRNESDYTRITYDLTMAAARALFAVNPSITFCYVSGQGTDSTERGRLMWARVKGRTENALLALPFRAFMFRPGFVRPAHGVRSRTALYRAVYAVAGPVYPILKRVFPKHVTTSENLGRAMIRVAVEEYPKRILENGDINALAEA
jgi:uncharacterized protein YbjT (DUF2867 family)